MLPDMYNAFVAWKFVDRHELEMQVLNWQEQANDQMSLVEDLEAELAEARQAAAAWKAAAKDYRQLAGKRTGAHWRRNLRRAARKVTP